MALLKQIVAKETRYERSVIGQLMQVAFYIIILKISIIACGRTLTYLIASNQATRSNDEGVSSLFSLVTAVTAKSMLQQSQVRLRFKTLASYRH